MHGTQGGVCIRFPWFGPESDGAFLLRVENLPEPHGGGYSTPMPTLDWIGKKAVVNHHLRVPYRLLKDVPSLSCGDPGTGNLIVQGDNLLALKALLPFYAGQVKCIYIDPPYNTGNEGWAYNDNVKSPTIQKWLGEVVGGEGETLDRHDRWLCMMYPRLALLREFLREDGSIWISIDDDEVHYLKGACDEIFGRQNFVANVVWQHSVQSKGYSGKFSLHHNHVLCYRKSSAFVLFDLLRTEEHNVNYSNPDNDPRGKWRPGDVRNSLVRKNLMYDISAPNGNIIKHPPKGWRFSKETFEEELSAGKIKFSDDGKRIIRKIYLCDQTGRVPETLWMGDEVGTTREANGELKELGLSLMFDTPKPVRLLERVLQVATSPGDLIMDSFAGSGTTGHAVLKVNTEKPDESPRRFILVEMEPEIANNITSERVRRVAGGYANAKGESVPGLGGGFRFCELGGELFDELGQIRDAVAFGELARHVWFTEFHEPLPRERVPNSPFLGTCNGVGLYLLYNGILGDKSTNGGNVLTRAILERLPPYDGPKIIYCAGNLLGPDRLRASSITIRQTPYEIKVS